MLGLGLIAAFVRTKKKKKRKRGTSGDYDSDAYDGSTITSSLKSYGNKKQKNGDTTSVAESKVCHCNKQLCHVCGQLEERGTTQFIPVGVISAISEKSEKPIRNIATAPTIPTGNKGQGGQGNIVTPTYADLEAAVLKGDWVLVEEISRLLGEANADEIASFNAPLRSSQDSALSSGLGGTSVVDYGFNALRMSELDGYFEVGNFAAARDVAAKYAAVDYAASSGMMPTESAEKTVEELKEIKSQALRLLDRVAPAEAEHIDLLMSEFKGREEMLVEQLMDLSERRVLKNERAVNMVKAKKDGKRQAKLSRAEGQTEGKPVFAAGTPMPPGLAALEAAKGGVKEEGKEEGEKEEEVKKEESKDLETPPIPPKALGLALSTFSVAEEGDAPVREIDKQLQANLAKPPSLPDFSEVDIATAIAADDWDAVRTIVGVLEEMGSALTGPEFSAADFNFRGAGPDSIACQKIELIISLISELEYLGVEAAIDAFSSSSRGLENSSTGLSPYSRTSQD